MTFGGFLGGLEACMRNWEVSGTISRSLEAIFGFWENSPPVTTLENGTSSARKFTKITQNVSPELLYNTLEAQGKINFYADFMLMNVVWL